jgi:hypothetical protein
VQNSDTATLEEKPVDVIVFIGNNGSLAQEIAAVEENINVSFADILEASSVDYQVILVSRSGAHQFNICVEAPLGGAATGECILQENNNAPVHNPPKFYHYSLPIDQNDTWCKLLDSYDGTVPDEYGQAPNGWSEWLRVEAAKVFITITDSRIDCLHDGFELDEGPSQPNDSDLPNAETVAAKMDEFILGLSEAHFGTADARNYYWHSIVGLEAIDPQNPATAWQPDDPITTVKCSSADTSPTSPSIGNQALSRITGGLRFPVCEVQNYDTVFSTIAQGIIQGTAVSCAFPLPEPPQGQTLDLETVQVKYTPGDGGDAVTFVQVDTAGDCTDDGFYIENEEIVLCPGACALVTADLGAEIDVLFGCDVIGPD